MNLDLERGDKLFLDLLIYFFSYLSLTLIPNFFGRKIWWVVAWFIAVNFIFLLGFIPGFNLGNPLLFLALGQLPWVLIVADLIFSGKLSSKIGEIPVHEILLWQITRLMGLHFILGIFGGHVSAEFAAPLGMSEVLTGIGAVILFFGFNPEKNWHKTVLIFWNTYGLTSVLSGEYHIVVSNPSFGFSRSSNEVFQYITAYPQNWQYCFWFPIAICLHATIFYKIYLMRKSKVYI